MTKIAIIGGTGLEDPEILENQRELVVDTPFGVTTSSFLEGEINGTHVVMLSRHDRGHTIPPTHVNNQANIFAIQTLECTHIIATTACGSLREEIGRGDLVFPDQFIDFTKHRKSTYFDYFKDGDLKHTPMADPFSRHLRERLIESASELQLSHHASGTVITIEGPRFSTRAESRMFRLWGADVVNMSTAPEVILANELKIPYACVAMSTDYDAWKEDEDPVTWEDVLKVFKANVERVIQLISNTLPKI
jgi:5'-methylthioadenosine phosphorylase